MSAPNPRLSLLYITRDRKHELLHSLRVAQRQSARDYEIIVLDQGSTDGTAEAVADEFANVRVVRSSTNLGVAGGRNAVAALARGNYLVFMDDDAEFGDPTALAEVGRVFENNSQVGVVGFRIHHAESGAVSNWCYPNGMRRYANVPFRSWAYVGCAHAIRRALFEQVRGYDEELFFWGDELSFVLRLLAQTEYEVVYWPRVVVLHRFSPTHRSAWSNSRLYYQVRNRLLLTWWYYPDRRSAVLSTLYYAGAYLLRAMAHRAIGQYARGWRDAIRTFPKNAPLKQPLNRRRFQRYRNLMWAQRLLSWGGVIPGLLGRRADWGAQSRSAEMQRD